MSHVSIAAVVLTKNEEKQIDACLESVAWCDELLVIDDRSEDRTVALAEKAGARVISRDIEGDFAAQRNFALNGVSCDWVLFVDADERVSSQLRDEIKTILSETEVDAFRLKRKDVFIGKELRYGDTGSWAQVRLARRGWGIWRGTVHEEWLGSENIGLLETHLLHEPHDSIGAFLTSINEYTTLRAQELFNAGNRTGWLSIVLYPKLKFMDLYIWKQGFRDGSHGLVHAFLMSFHSFLVRSKLYLLSRNL